MKTLTPWIVVIIAFGAMAFAPRTLDLWWLSVGCAAGWIVAARKKVDAASLRTAFGVAYLMLTERELLQHRWF